MAVRAVTRIGSEEKLLFESQIHPCSILVYLCLYRLIFCTQECVVSDEGVTRDGRPRKGVHVLEDLCVLRAAASGTALHINHTLKSEIQRVVWGYDKKEERPRR